jgi:hypothetical protein
MKQWVCIDNKGYEQMLIVGKVYAEITDAFVDQFCILIKDETGILSEYYQPLRFVTIDEWRELQLKKIGI